MHHLDERQRVGGGATASAYTLLKQGHCEFLVRNAVLGSTYVLFAFIRNVEVNSHQQIFKALCSIVHDSQLEALLILESLCQSSAESVRGKHFFTATLKLVKNALESTEDAGVAHALVSCKLPKATAEDVQVPQNLQGTVEEAAVLPWLIAETFAGGNRH